LTGNRVDLALEQRDYGGDDQCSAKHLHYQTVFHLMSAARGEKPQGQCRRWHAAIGKPPHHLPVGMALAVVHAAADHLGERGEPQVRPHRRRRRYAEQQDHDRRHQRTATNPGETHHRADKKAGERVQKIHQAASSIMRSSTGRACSFRQISRSGM
jgi:hypothetical protein